MIEFAFRVSFFLQLSSSHEIYSVVLQIFSFNTWCSGMWICTATGSTAAMRNAGGREMNLRSRSLQYMVREHLAEEGQEHLRASGHGMIGERGLQNMICDLMFRYVPFNHK